MEPNTIANNESRYQRIINVLLLNASFIDNLGLMHGKMGIAIYFFHLARETKNQIYENYAGELIDEIYEEITINTPLDFENGLAGIGWGIEYLVQNGFIDAVADNVLEDFYIRLQPSQYKFQGTGLMNGLLGLGAFYLKRLQNPTSSDEKVTTLINKQILIHLIDELERRIKDEGIIDLINKNTVFDLAWDFPILITFLSEVYQLNLLNFKVERLLGQLIDPLFQPENILNQHSKRLQMVLAFEKVIKCKVELWPDGAIKKLIQNLLIGIVRETISNELTPNSAFMQNGTSGIAWINSQLFQLTDKEYYQKEALFWHTRSFEFFENNQGYAGFYVAKENEDKAFGFLVGLSGINY